MLNSNIYLNDQSQWLDGICKVLHIPHEKVLEVNTQTKARRKNYL